MFAHVKNTTADGTPHWGYSGVSVCKTKRRKKSVSFFSSDVFFVQSRILLLDYSVTSSLHCCIPLLELCGIHYIPHLCLVTCFEASSAESQWYDAAGHTFVPLFLMSFIYRFAFVWEKKHLTLWTKSRAIVFFFESLGCPGFTLGLLKGSPMVNVSVVDRCCERSPL